MDTKTQLIAWIIGYVTSFAPSYLDSRKVIFVDFFGSGTVVESDGIQIQTSSQVEMNTKISQVRKGKGRWLMVATLADNDSFRLRSVGMRGSGSSSLYIFAIVEGSLIIKLESSALMA